MNLKKLLGLVLTCVLAFALNVEAKEKILFIPIDDRPVCFDYTVNTLKAAGWDIEVPPREYIASYNRNGDPDKLYQWLEDNAALATDAVVSSDSLIYGGLVPSRTHKLGQELLEQRTQRLLNIKKQFPFLRIYVFGTVMRSPKASSAPAEPAYYAKYGWDIFRMGAFKDQQEQGKLKSRDKKELAMLLKSIPQEIQNDLYTRRAANLKVTLQLLRGVKDNAFDYFLLGRDDTSVYSDAHRDARSINKVVSDLPQWKIRFFMGADQLGLILLNRAVNKIEGTTPIVYTFYSEGQGAEMIPIYEDVAVDNTIRNHILAAAAYPANRAKNADLVLAVNAARVGKLLEAPSPLNTTKLTNAHKNFLKKVSDYLCENKRVGIADVAYGNGADNALMKGLFTTKMRFAHKLPVGAGVGSAARAYSLAWCLSSYAGWNTASNTVGYTIGQGLLRPYISETQKNDLMSVRYLDDWVYEANVRGAVRTKLVWPSRWVDGSLKPAQRSAAEEAVTKEMRGFACNYFEPAELDKWEYVLPWSRMFEVYVRRKNKLEG